MNRIIVAGGRGFFGAAAVDRLRQDGLQPLVAGRRAPVDVEMDAEDPRSIRAALAGGDLVIDAAGPFHARTTALVDAAIEIGFDLIDLADSLEYVRRIQSLRHRIDGARIRVLTACSSVSALSAALVGLSGLDPVRVDVLLAPATRYTASRGTGAALRHSVGCPVRVLRSGQLVTSMGWRESRRVRMPLPIGMVQAHAIESVDAVTLPRIWPGLQRVDLWVTTRSPALDGVFFLAARVPLVAAAVSRAEPLGIRVARMFGARSGGFGVEIADAAGTVIRHGFVATSRSYLAAVAPAVVAARTIAEDSFPFTGLVPHHQQVDANELIRYLGKMGIEYQRWEE